MPEPPDPSIVERAIRGDAMAFRILVKRYQGFVYRVAYRFVGTIGDAEDIAQETFVRVWKHLHRYNSDTRMTTWLYRIVANLCLDHLKSRDARATRTSRDVADYPGIPEQSGSDQGLMDDELHRVVERMSATLSPKQQAVFVLRDLEELEIAEICKILSMDAGKVKSNLYYARKRISELVARYYDIKKNAIL